MSKFDIRKKKAFVCDLDGTLFMGPNPIKPAVDFVIENTKSGRFCFFYITNNTAKTPAEVTGHRASLWHRAPRKNHAPPPNA